MSLGMCQFTRILSNQISYFSAANDSNPKIFIFFTCVLFFRSEHERHSPACPFVKGEYTQNVPLSVTYASAPASPLVSVASPDQAQETQAEHLILGTSSVSELAV